MALHPFRIVNVFTQDGAALSGNPLCVFENGAALDTAAMQALARQFNLSETTFILPSAAAQARVRIFTPSYEMAFAGHPTLGTAHVCRALGLGTDALRLEMQAGIVAVQAAGPRWTLTAPEPTWREPEVSMAALAAALSLEAQDLGATPLWVKSGKEQLVVPLASADAVRRAAPQPALFGAIKSEDHLSMAYVFAEQGNGRTLARFFFPDGAAVLEDPATGSATANYGGWCIATGQALPLSREISQGAQTGRPSTLHLDIDDERHIRVSGEVIEIARGVVTL